MQYTVRMYVYIYKSDLIIGENLSEHQSPHPGMVTHMVYQEPTTNGSEGILRRVYCYLIGIVLLILEASVQEKRQSYFVHRVQSAYI